MELPILRDFVTIFGLAIVVLLVCHRIRIPTMVGLIITGVVGGPNGFGLVQAATGVETLAKVGVIFLLFTIGMEFSPKKILSLRKSFLVGGFLQVGFTILGGFITAIWIGRPIPEAIFLGFLISLSSTAIILKLISDRAEAKSRHGRITLAILIFQDIAVVLMVLLVPFLGGTGEFSTNQVIWAVGQGALIIVAAFLFALYVVTPLLDMVARTRSRELFLLAVLTICFSVTWLSSISGLSISLGAFLAGIVLSESEYRHQALGNILPLQDIFTSFFFISIGMLLEIDFLLENIPLVTVTTLSVIALKAIIAAGSTLALGMPLRTAIIVGLSLSQVGEFSFVLANAGLKAQIGESYLYQIFISVSLVTMLLTPLLILVAPYVANAFYKLPISKRLLTGKVQSIKEEKELGDHVIIAGFGVSGKNLAKSCQLVGIPYAALETNPDIVREERLKGEPIYFGDAGHLSVLEHLNVGQARAVAILVNDFEEERRVMEVVKRANPHAFTAVRTHELAEREVLYSLGADEVVVDEFVTSAEIINRILRQYSVSFVDVDRALGELSEGEYPQKKGVLGQLFSFVDFELDLPEVAVEAWKLGPDSPYAGKALEAVDLRPKYGVNVLVVHRGTENLVHVTGDTVIESGDVLIVFGTKEHLREAAPLAVG